MKKLKEEYLQKRRVCKINKEPQHGISVFIEYDYLLNTDLDWIIKNIHTIQCEGH